MCRSFLSIGLMAVCSALASAASFIIAPIVYAVTALGRLCFGVIARPRFDRRDMLDTFARIAADRNRSMARFAY